MRRVIRVASYRFGSTFRDRLGGYLQIALLIALLGGVAMGAAAGARRNQSAYPAFLASTHPSEISFPTATYGFPGAPLGYNPSLLAKIARLPHVQRVESSIGFNGGPVDANGQPVKTPANFDVGNDVSVNGLGFTQDRITVTRGRMADPARADEMMVSPEVAKVLADDGYPLGSMVPVIIVGNNQLSESFKQILAHPALKLDMHLVGVGVLNNAVIEDDVDVAGSQFYEFTPALARRLLQCCAQDTATGLRLDGGSREVPAVEAELEKLAPNLPHDFFLTPTVVAKSERAVKPDSIAFGAFGLIALLATLLIASQVIGRQLRAGGDDLDTLRALGAGPAMTTSDGLIGVFGSVALGALLAGVVAVALSPLAPMGPVRRVYPSRGIAFDWTVLGAGIAVLIVGLGVVAVVLAYHRAPHSVARRASLTRTRRLSAAQAAAAAGFPVPVVTGIRFALEPGGGKNTVPVRSAILGAVLAMVVVVGTLTFGASLRTLVSRPPLYGWNWTYELSGGSGVGAIPQQQSAALLKADHDVAAWTGVYFAGAAIDGQTEPIIAGSPNAGVGPPVLSGHGLDARNEIVLGAVTMAALHKHLGDTVEVTDGNVSKRLRIVGTATMPTVGGEGSQLHATMGTGALLSYALVPPADLAAPGNTPPGPNAIFVRLRPGANDVAARRRLNDIATKLTLPTNYGVALLGVERPAEIVDYRSMSATPLYLGAVLGVGAVAALALTLIASVRRRRRDLALFKTFGFTRRQLAATVSWQASVAVAIGTVVGVPLGVALGRFLWSRFAAEIHAVPAPATPVAAIAVVVVGALVLGNLVAAFPARQAARTPTALLLQAE